MRTVSEETLVDCLELLSQGLTIEQILAQYPGQNEALRPFLETAIQLTELATQPTLAAKERSSRAMLQEATEIASGRKTSAPIWVGLRRLLMPAASFATILVLVGAMLFFMSASSLPGDGLYQAKQWVERVRLAPLTDSDARSSLQESFNQERIREVEALLRSGRDAEVRFEGRIGELEKDHWTIAAIRVEIVDETVVEGLPQTGAMAQLHGRTHDGKLTAIHIVVTDGEPAEVDDPTQIEPESSPTVTMTPVATETSGPTATSASKPTAEPTGTLSPATPTATTSPVLDDAPTAPPPVSPDPTAVPDGGGDQEDAGDGDDANQNGDVEDGNDDSANENDDDDENENENENDNSVNENDDNANENDDDDHNNVNDDESDEEDDESDDENDNEPDDEDNENDSSGRGNGNRNDNT